MKKQIFIKTNDCTYGGYEKSKKVKDKIASECGIP